MTREINYTISPSLQGQDFIVLWERETTGWGWLPYFLPTTQQCLRDMLCLVGSVSSFLHHGIPFPPNKVRPPLTDTYCLVGFEDLLMVTDCE